MKHHGRGFLSGDEGAITTEWIVITALVIGMAWAVVEVVSIGAQDPVRGVGARLSSIEVEVDPGSGGEQ